MKDLTKGYPARVIFMFALPLMLGNIFQNLYNMADAKIVSAYVGTTAFAAVGATSVVSDTLIGFVNGLTQGFAIMIATSFGAKDEKRMRKYVAGTIILTALATVFLTVTGLFQIERILRALSTPDDIMADALSYVRIILAGIVFTAIYNMFANMLRAVGDSKTPLYCLLVAVVVNIGLDLLFVGGFRWGIRGAAYATLMAQAFSGGSCGIYSLIKFKELFPKREEWKPESRFYRELTTTGLSMGLMGCIVNIGTVVLQSAINSLGTKIVAAHTAARRVFCILMILIFTIGTAMTTYVSQNMGAGRIDRIKQGVRHALFIVTAESVAIIAICYLFGEGVIRWVTNTDDAELIGAAVMYIKVSVWFSFVLGPLFILRCSLQGMGRKIIPVFSSVLEMLVKVVSAMFLVPALKYFGVALTEPISWCIMTTLLATAYLAKPPEKMMADMNRKL